MHILGRERGGEAEGENDLTQPTNKLQVNLEVAKEGGRAKRRGEREFSMYCCSCIHGISKA